MVLTSVSIFVMMETKSVEMAAAQLARLREATAVSEDHLQLQMSALKHVDLE